MESFQTKSLWQGVMTTEQMTTLIRNISRTEHSRKTELGKFPLLPKK